jgi:hypothetical protein
MPILDLFSKRQKVLRGEVPEIYSYKLTQKFKVQVVHIIRDAIGETRYSNDHTLDADKIYGSINKALCKEYGVFDLGSPHDSDKYSVQNFFLKTDDSEKALDVIELSFKIIGRVIKESHEYGHNNNIEISPDEAVEELNERFKENGIGFQYEGGEIIRVDSTYAHSEIVKPTLSLLWNTKFGGANEEYLKAHEHYRHGRNKECLTECLKAFESTMKIICKEKGWPFNQNDTSKKLIQICFQNNLMPSFTQNQFTSLQSLMESGIPTIRNKLGGHGQGQVPQKVDDEMARYALNLTGSNIIFLVDQSEI